MAELRVRAVAAYGSVSLAAVCARIESLDGVSHADARDLRQLSAAVLRLLGLGGDPVIV